MISPQQPATTAMGELTWAQVMPAEAYWRERISKEIEEINLDEAKEISADYYHGARRMRLVAYCVAKGKE
jgi:hypothetical protein